MRPCCTFFYAMLLNNFHACLSLPFSHNYGKNFPHFHKISCLDSQAGTIKAPGTTEDSGVSACKLNRGSFFFLTSQPNALREVSEVLKPI